MSRQLGLALLMLSALPLLSVNRAVAALPPTSWVLQGLRGRAPLDGTTLTLRFEAGRLSGSDGCNRYSAAATVNGTALSIAPVLLSTRKACPPRVSRQAEAFQAALQGTRGFRLVDGGLRLLSASRLPLLSFIPASDVLSGTRWRVTGLTNSRGGVAAPLPGTALTLGFQPGGRVDGKSGCNRYAALATIGADTGGEQLRFSTPVATRRFCATPAGVMAQEQRFLTALAMVRSLVKEGRRLELRREDGAAVLQLLRQSPP